MFIRIIAILILMTGSVQAQQVPATPPSGQVLQTPAPAVEAPAVTPKAEPQTTGTQHPASGAQAEPVVPEVQAPALVQAPASRVALVLPDGFVASKRFKGFVNTALKATIEVRERPASAYGVLAGSLKASRLGKRNITQVTPEKLARKGEYVYVAGRQLSKAVPYARFFLVFKESETAVLVTVNAPAEAFKAGKLKRADIEDALASATLGEARAASGLRAAFGYTGPFKEATGFGVRAKLYTLDGAIRAKQGSGEGARAYVLVNASSSQRYRVRNSLGVAGPMIRRAGGVSGLHIVRVGRAKIAGFPAVVHDARAKQGKAGAPVLVRQVFLVRKPGGWYRILAVVPEKSAKTLAPEVEKMLKSFKE